MDFTALSYRIEGQGAPLLMIHGFGLTYNIWRRLRPRLLAAGRQLIMVELPGMGASPPPEPERAYNAVCAERLLALRRHLGLPAWDVLAYSCGTRAAEAYVQLDAAAVGRLVYLCPMQLRLPQLLSLHLIGGLDKLWPAFGDWALSGARFKTLMLLLAFGGRQQPEAAAWQAEITAQPLAMLKLTLRMLLPYGLRPLQAGGRPLLRIWGSRDLVALPPWRLAVEDVIIPATHAAPALADAAIEQALQAFWGCAEPQSDLAQPARRIYRLK